LLTDASLKMDGLTALEWALVLEDIPLASLIIKYGGPGASFDFLKPLKEKKKPKEGEKVEEEEEEEEEDPHPLSATSKGAYMGMVMEGAKRESNEHVPFNASLPKDACFPIHTMAYYGKRKALDFLLGGEATKLLHEYFTEIAYKECDTRCHFLQKYAQGDVNVASKRLFGLDSLDVSGKRNVFHYAIKVHIIFFFFFQMIYFNYLFVFPHAKHFYSTTEQAIGDAELPH